MSKGEADIYESPQEAIDNNQRGTIYVVNTLGDITHGGQAYGTNDILYANGSLSTTSYDPSDNSMQVNKADVNLGDLKSGDNGNYNYLSVNNASVGYSLFTFLSLNTTVEWSLVLGYESYLSTSHNPTDEEGGLLLIMQEIQRYGVNSVSTFIHDHPDNKLNYNGLYGPSGFYELDKTSGGPNSDWAAAAFLDNLFPANNIVFAVFDVRTSGIFFYNAGEAPGPSWYPNITGPSSIVYKP